MSRKDSYNPLNDIGTEELAVSYQAALEPGCGNGAPVRVVQRVDKKMNEVFDVWDVRPLKANNKPILVYASLPDFEQALEMANDFAYGRVRVAVSSRRTLLETGK